MDFGVRQEGDYDSTAKVGFVQVLQNLANVGYSNTP